jgi:hypothetical protein
MVIVRRGGKWEIGIKRFIKNEVYPSTLQHKCWGLPSTRAQAEGLRVDPALR